MYLRDGQLQRENGFESSETERRQMEEFLAELLASDVDLPAATVVDVGVMEGRGWAVVEQNDAWGSGIYGCDPEQVLEVLRHAAVRAE